MQYYYYYYFAYVKFATLDENIATVLVHKYKPVKHNCRWLVSPGGRFCKSDLSCENYIIGNYGFMKNL